MSTPEAFPGASGPGCAACPVRGAGEGWVQVSAFLTGSKEVEVRGP